LNTSNIFNLEPPWHAWSEQQRQVQAKTEHLRVLFRHAIYVFLGNLSASITLVIGMWQTTPQNWLIAWVTAMLILNLARWLVGRRFPVMSIGEVETQRWEFRFIASVVLSGVLWGIAGSLFYVPGNLEHNLFLALVIISISAAATAPLSYHRIAYPLFLVPAITPILLHLMLDDALLARAIGFIAPFYFLLLYLLSKEIYQTAHESILSRINSQYQAMFDYLTGLANRRTFEEAMNREWYRSIRNKHVLSLIVADIDNFKLCNDSHGHATGDQVLKAVAVLLENRIRRGADLVARIGGEEFAIILPNTDLVGAEALAENIRVGIKELAKKDELEIPEVTMSFGVASLLPDDSNDAGSLFSYADEALYQAKRKGKDMVVTMDVE